MGRGGTPPQWPPIILMDDTHAGYPTFFYYVQVIMNKFIITMTAVGMQFLSK
jgi:hypothetical protein